MTRDEIEAFFARRQESWERLDSAALAQDYTDDGCVDSPLAGGTATGRDAVQRLYETYFRAFPDFTLRQESLLIDGNHAVILGRISGTDTGGFMGMAPSGRNVTAPVALFYELRDGLIVRERRIYDFTGVLVQVGLLKAKPI
jgi:steroid delta-isomerase-like uncharacterized protein